MSSNDEISLKLCSNLVPSHKNKLHFNNKCLHVIHILYSNKANYTAYPIAYIICIDHEATWCLYCMCARTFPSVFIRAGSRRNTICRRSGRIRQRIMDSNFCDVLRRRKYGNSNKM